MKNTILASFLKKKEEATAENLEEFRDITDDVIEGDFVPYACHWDPHTIVTKNGEVLQTIRITGFVHELAENIHEDITLRDKIREAVKECIDSTKYAVWIHTIRRRKSLKTDGEYQRDFAGYLDHFWNDKNDWEHKFVNEVYLTVVREGKGAKVFESEIMTRCMMPTMLNRYFESAIDKACEEINALTAKMLPILNCFGAELLGVSKRDGRYYSDICEFLGKLTTLRDIEFPLKEVNLSHALTDYDVTFGYNAMEVRMRADNKRRFGAILTVREYRELEIGALDLLLQIPAEFIISQSFEFLTAKLAVQGYEYQKELLVTSKSQRLYDRIGLKDIIESNKGNKTDFGQHQINIFLLADSIKALESGVANAAKALSALGMTPMREDIKSEECYWAQLPGNFEFIKRMRPINTARIGGFANLSNLSAGNGHNNHWGPAVTTFHTAAHTPYFFNFHKGDNGHTLIVGQPGAGQSVLLNFLLAEARKFDNRLFYFDVDRSAEIFLRSLGGQYYNTFAGDDSRPQAHTSMNPFMLEDTPRNRAFLGGWLTTLAGNAGAAIADLPALCKQAVADVIVLPPEQRNLATCIGFLRQHNAEAAEAFRAWMEGGEFASVFSSGPEPKIFDAKIVGLEMTTLMQHGEPLIPVVAYLLYRMCQHLDGKPTIIVLREAWTLLDNSYFYPQLDQLLDDLRAHNAMVIMETDHISDAFGSGLNALLVEKTATQIYLPDPVPDDAYATAFRLTDNEIAYLAAMNTDDRHFMVKRDRETIVCELNIGEMRDILAVLSAHSDALQLMEKMMEQHGTEPVQWMPVFLRNI
ncbi:MAG TPA: ATP-binding protein [Rickettsiales bacterium]|nr:ATP-binding protein [Rickettsiales bacterium]